MGVFGGTSVGVSAGVSVGVAVSASSPDGLPPPGPEGSGVAMGWGPVPGFAAAGFSDMSTGVRARVSSCGVHILVSVDVAVSGVVKVDVAVSGVARVDVAVSSAVRVDVDASGAVGMGVGRMSAPVGGCATGAGTVVVAGGAATTITCPVAKDGFPRIGVARGDSATPPVAVASAMAVGGPLCGPQPVALSSPLTTVGESVGETSPSGALLAVGVTVLSTDNSARGNLAPPSLARG